jgi:hypothetical protein
MLLSGSVEADLLFGSVRGIFEHPLSVLPRQTQPAPGSFELRRPRRQLVALHLKVSACLAERVGVFLASLLILVSRLGAGTPNRI